MQFLYYQITVSAVLDFNPEFNLHRKRKFQISFFLRLQLINGGEGCGGAREQFDPG
jgi:hypothetical protein